MITELNANQFALKGAPEPTVTPLVFIGTPEIKFSKITGESDKVMMTITATCQALVGTTPPLEIPPAFNHCSVGSFGSNVRVAGNLSIGTSISGETTTLEIGATNILTNLAKGRFDNFGGLAAITVVE